MLLLDTHAFLWFESNDPKLPQNVMDTIQTEERVYVSIASFWEIAIKNSMGKLNLGIPINELMNHCVSCGFEIMPIKGNHLAQLTVLPWIHRDPFDRLLVSQARAESLTLVTIDENIVKYEVKTLWKP